MFAHEFVRNAYLAGTAIAIACGAVGWFVLLRGQLFAGDAHSHVAFVGPIAAAVIGLDERIGLFALTLVAAVGMSGLGRRGHADDAAIGVVLAWVLGVGVLLLALLATSQAGGNGIVAANALFGSIYSLSAAGSRLATGLALLAAAGLALILRPLLLSTLDPQGAVVRGVRVRAIGLAFLVLLALVTADGTQAVGALLILGLLAAPAGAAHRLTANPYRGIALSILLAIGAVWGGLAISYAAGSIPPSSAVIGLAALAYGTSALPAWRRQHRSNPN